MELPYAILHLGNEIFAYLHDKVWHVQGNRLQYDAYGRVKTRAATIHDIICMVPIGANWSETNLEAIISDACKAKNITLLDVPIQEIKMFVIHECVYKRTYGYESGEKTDPALNGKWYKGYFDPSDESAIAFLRHERSVNLQFGILELFKKS